MLMGNYADGLDIAKVEDFCDFGAEDFMMHQACEDPFAQEWFKLGGESPPRDLDIPSCFGEGPYVASTHDFDVLRSSDHAKPDDSWRLDPPSKVTPYDSNSAGSTFADLDGSADATSPAVAAADTDNAASRKRQSPPEVPQEVPRLHELPTWGPLTFPRAHVNAAFPANSVMVPVMIPPSPQHPQGCVVMMMMQRMHPMAMPVPTPGRPSARPVGRRSEGAMIKAWPPPPAAPPLSKGALPNLTLEETRAARQVSLARYREKKARRLSSNTIRYHLRKINADNRPRVRGRFVKKDEPTMPADADAQPQDLIGQYSAPAPVAVPEALASVDDWAKL